ncbi:hypothetical protein EVAR_74756_1 [Eumeta japonica]|uniref:Uncharacterized protein n=1 Tax=Eumeta variegata TaxID=151549 RepID=A0A4C1SRZ0_EUMVA|nr:hypothetical protein EVAR_74756_1 [Eumeta japonica]
MCCRATVKSRQLRSRPSKSLIRVLVSWLRRRWRVTSTARASFSRHSRRGCEKTIAIQNKIGSATSMSKGANSSGLKCVYNRLLSAAVIPQFSCCPTKSVSLFIIIRIRRVGWLAAAGGPLDTRTGARVCVPAHACARPDVAFCSLI